MRNFSSGVLAVVVLGLFGNCSWGQSLPPGKYSFTSIGLTGSGYEYSNGFGFVRSTTALDLNSSGQVGGESDRYSNIGTLLGSDAWIYSAGSTHLIGFTGGNYEYYYDVNGDEGLYRGNYFGSLNTAGQALGDDGRFDVVGHDLGQDTWLYSGGNTILIGLQGSGYEYLNGLGWTYRFSGGQQLNDAGQVAGFNKRYNTQGTSLGEDAWLYSGGTTQLMGLTGSGYQYTLSGAGVFRFSRPTQLNGMGDVVGTSNRYNSSGTALGQDAWVYSGGSTHLIGLTGAGYEYTLTGAGGGTYRYGSAVRLNAAGQISGYSSRYSATGNAIGQDAWLYSAGDIQQIGLIGSGYEYTYAGTGGGTYRDVEVELLNPAGQAEGYTTRYNTAGTTLGRDAWLFSNGTNQMIGLTGSGYEYITVANGGGNYRSSSGDWMNATGQVAGSAFRYNASGNGIGADSWLFSSGSTNLIGLTGTGYEYTYTGAGGGTYRLNYAQQINSNGQVIGYASRYNTTGASRGQAGWFYDDSTKTTTPLIFSTNSNGISITTPDYLTDSGVVLGTYRLFSGATNIGDRAFWWSSTAGFYDLGSLVQGALTAAQWQYLGSVYDTGVPGTASTTPGGAPYYIVGTGFANSDYLPGHSVYLLTAVVPEPASLGLVALASVGLLRRRR